MNKEIEIFKLKNVNNWIEEAKERPVPKMLFGEFWLEGELCILFADTGKGKSILAVQIAESIAKGVAIEPMQLTAQAQTVIYFDFELSSKQFEMRYAAEPDEGEEYLRDHYRFPDNFYRAEIDVDGDFPQDFATFEAYMRTEVERMIRTTEAKVVIIDNITYLRGANDTARHSIPLMRELKRLKKELGLSILVLAHTPKRSLTRPLTVNDLQGSKVLSNFADNVFAIGQSSIDSSFRYIKHIKPRSTELFYDSGNVLVGEIRKWENNFLTFRFHKFSPESDHLTKEPNSIIQARAELVRDMTERGKTQREIAAAFGVSVGTINRYLHMTEEDDDYINDKFYDPEEDKEEESTPKTEKTPRPSWDPYGYHEQNNPEYFARRMKGEVRDDDDDEDEDPMARYGLKGFDAGISDEPEYESEEEPEEETPKPVKYKTMDDKIEVGDIVLTESGQLKRKTLWGWDATVDGLDAG